MSDSEVTIAVCTRNRDTLLAACLLSLEAELRTTNVEVLVTDNGSTDRTKNILRAWSDDRQRRVVEEQRPGLSHARNRALIEARGDIVCFIDDDATSRPGLAVAYRNLFGAREHVVAAGGRVKLRFEAGRPTWASPQIERFWSGFDMGDQPARISAPRAPYGCNFAVDRLAVQAVGGFDPRLGHRRRSLMPGEEPELAQRLRAEGGSIWYTPNAVVDHLVVAGRQRLHWVVRRAYSQGRSETRRGYLGETRFLRGVRPHASRVAAEIGDLRRDRHRRNTDDLMLLASQLGGLDEAVRHRLGLSCFPAVRLAKRGRRPSRFGAHVHREDYDELRDRLDRLERSHRDVHGAMLTDIASELRALRRTDD